jgi:MFS transporter, DHA3 family, tetracycline resistance protein
MPKRLPAYAVYLATEGAFATFFTMMAMISAIYRVQSAGLNPLQLVLVGTVLEASVFLFEVPTGIVADLYSRRLSVIIGYLLIGLGFTLEGLFPSFLPILLAQVTWGIGATFTSGAESAWLADEVGDEKLRPIYLRASQLGQAGALLGIGISVALGSIALNLPILAGGLCTIGLALFLALFMPETGFRPTPRPERNTWQKMADTFGDGLRTVRGRPLLVTMLAIAAVYGLASEGLDRLWEAHFLANFEFPPVAGIHVVGWFGLINVGELVLVIGATEYVRRRLRDGDDEKAVRALQLIHTVMIGGAVAFGLVRHFGLAVITVWMTFIFRRMSEPLYAAWLNKGLPSETRATVLSMRGQVDAIGQLVGGPIIGAVATGLGLRAAMIGVGLMLTPALPLYRLGLRLMRQSPVEPRDLRPLAVEHEMDEV